MDHDSIAGAEEFLAAAKAAHMGATIGMECRASFADTPFGDRKLNNPDQKGIVYMALHGVPHDRAAELNALFAPYREKAQRPQPQDGGRHQRHDGQVRRRHRL